MPLYEYECRSCQSRFEQLILDRNTEAACRRCGSTDVVQLLSTFAVGGDTSRPAAPSGCAGCPGMQGGACPMNQE